MYVPEIYSFYNNLSDDAKLYLREHVFYLHERHLQFGEVLVESLSELEAKFAEIDLQGLNTRAVAPEARPAQASQSGASAALDTDADTQPSSPTFS